MKNRNNVLFVILACTLMTSCEEDIFRKSGNGISETEVRRVAKFNKIENYTSIDIIYKKADTTGLTITADENLLEYIITKTDNSTLEIRTTDIFDCLDFRTNPTIVITSPDLESIFSTGSGAFFADSISGKTVNLNMSGSGILSAGNVNGNFLKVILSGSGDIKINNASSISSDVLLSGSGNIELKGQSETSDFKLSGSGKVHSEHWVLGSAGIIISGSGDIYTHVDNTLTALISGSGNIFLKGYPKITQTTSGSGRIINY